MHVAPLTNDRHLPANLDSNPEIEVLGLFDHGEWAPDFDLLKQVDNCSVDKTRHMEGKPTAPLTRKSGRFSTPIIENSR